MRVRVEAVPGRGPSQRRLLAGSLEPLGRDLFMSVKRLGAGTCCVEEEGKAARVGVTRSLSLMLEILRVTECAGKPAFQ